LNGIDGDATLGISTSACSVCHTAVNSAATIHHVSKNNFATNGNCAFCHKASSTGGSVVGNHAGNHTNLVATDTNCVPCHSANVGGSSGAPVDGSVVANKIHDTCVSCHATTGALKTLAAVGGTKVIAMPAGTAASNDGGGNCTACHGAYFTNHSHSHATTVTTAALCGSCHTGDTISGTATHKSNCADCHNLSTGARVNGGANAASYGGIAKNVGDATVNAGAGGTCATCHTTYFNAHTHTHTFTASAACSSCHGNPTPATSNARDAIAAPFTTAGEVHATNGCATCHDLATNGALKGSALGKALATGCVDCHTATWTAIHTPATGVVHTGGRVGTTTGSCDTCHGAPTPASSDARDAQTTPYIAAGEVHASNGCATCHTTVGGLRVGGLTKAQTVAKGICTTCHTAVWNTVHASATVSHNVTATALCANCHTGDAVSGASTHNGNCADCHNLSTGARVNGAANAGSYGGIAKNVGDATLNGGAGGACATCHTAYFNAHLHDHTVKVTATAACATCHGNPTPATSNARDAASAPYVTTGEVHATNGCATCHLVATTGALTGSATGKTLGADCVGCHTGTWTAVHTAATGVLHTGGRVGATVGSCDTCHGAPTPASSDARDAQTTPYLAAGEVHAANGCATCHTGTNDGALRVAGLTKAQTVAKGTCTTCHTAAWNTVHATATVSHNVTGTTLCNTCHSGNTVSGAATHNNNCADCHNLSTGARVNGAFNAGSYGGIAKNVGDATVNAGVGGACAACHTTYFNAHTHNHGFTVTASCGTCHGNPSPASSGARDASVAPYTAAGEVHSEFGCASCHDLTTNGALKSLAVGKTTTSTCVDCHTGTWTALHALVTVDHATTRVLNDANCSSCHGNPTPATSNARDAGVSPFTAVGDVHATGCLTCHNADGTNRSTGLTKADRVGRGNCSYCHANTSTWTTIHTAKSGVSHATRVDGLAACNSCHTATAGGASGLMPVSAADNKVHDSCATCHAATGTLLAKATANVNGWVLGSMAKGDCSTCHTAAYFNSHVHGTTGGYVTHDVAYSASTDKSQAAPGTPCANCHVPTGLLTTWSGILNEHLGACATCHSYTNTDGLNSPPLATNNSVIATGTAVKCLTCHTEKASPATHGGHTATDFPWDATTQASCGTVGCHDYVANPDVVMNIHGGTCTICHSSSSGGDGTTIVGSATNGIDGNAQLGSTAAPHNDNCLVCHPTATYDLSTAHHTSKNGYAVAGNCVQCHTGTNYPGDHSGRVSLAANCAGCHTGGQGTSSGIPLDATDATVAARKLHDACTTCHNTDGDATLKGPYGRAQAMPNGGAGSNNGGGSCEACHTSGFSALHPAIDHSTRVSDSASCNTCHTATKGTATGIPVDATPTPHNKVHDACTTCHNGTTGALLGPSGHAGAMPVGGGTCTACHTSGTFTSLHDYATVDHSTKVTNTASCATCHTTTAGTLTGITCDTTGHTKWHDACATCHSDTTLSVLKTFYGRAQAMVAGPCAGCHTVTSFTTMHSYTVGHATQVADSASCNTCHTATKGTATGIPVDATPTPHNKVHDACSTCHNDTTGALVPPTGHAGAMPVGGGVCTACHTSGTFTSLHDWATVDHSAKVTSTASCTTSCHTATAGTASTIPVDATAHTKVHDSCATCHSDTTLAVMKAGYGHAPTNTIGACVVCHTQTSFTAMHDWATVDHSAMVTSTASCTTSCHTATAGTASTIPVDATAHTKVHDSCATCHSDTTLSVMKAGYGHAPTNTIGACVVCHTQTSFTAMHDWATVDHSAKVTSTASCTTSCHTATAGTASTIPVDASAHTKVHDACATCHSDTTLSVMKAGYGHAPTNTIGACVVCHTQTSFTAMHDWATVDHSTKVTGTASCITCHTGTAGTATTIPVSAADNKVHDYCYTCHSDTTLAVLKTAPIGTAAAMATGQCSTCHSTFAFANHSHTHDLTYTPATDTSQSPAQPCGNCHVPTVAGTLTTWAGVYEEHLSNCATCHSYTNADGQNSPPLTTNNTVIASGTSNKCLSCHTEKTAPATHGGHPSDFGKDTACTGCHTGASVLNNIHGNGTTATCTICHSGSPTRNNEMVGSATNGIDGDATLANGTAAAGTWTSKTCLTCHPDATYPGATVHHDDKNGVTAAGNCDTCHRDPRPTYAGGAILAYKQLSCSKCHVKPGATGIKVVKFTLKDRADGANSTLAGNTQADVANHVWPNTSVINNYGACFFCHGKNTSGTNGIGGGSTKKPKPFHGLPTPSLQTQIAEVGVAGVVDTNRMGGGGWEVLETAGWSVGSDGLDFRGAAGALGGSAWTAAYHPIGKTVMNIGWALLSQPKKASNNTAYKQNNTGLYANTAFNIPANMRFGVVSKSPNNADAIQYIPVFDTTMPTGTDTVTCTTGSAAWTISTNPGNVTARSLTVNCSSNSATAATLNLIYGGRVIATGTAGAKTINTTVNLDTLATTTLDATNKYNVFHTQNAGVMWVSSSNGGSLKIVPTGSPGQGAN
jgi:hypothetical protein